MQSDVDTHRRPALICRAEHRLHFHRRCHRCPGIGKHAHDGVAQRFHQAPTKTRQHTGQQ